MTKNRYGKKPESTPKPKDMTKVKAALKGKGYGKEGSSKS